MVLEVGPAVVRRLGADAGPPTEMLAAVLDGIDDPLVLLDERPVRVDDLLRSVIAQVLGGRCARVVVVLPSSWPAPRVARVVRAVAGSAERVMAVTRAELVRPELVVVEIDTLVVTVRAGDTARVFARAHVDAIAATAARYAGDVAREAGGIALDVPAGLPGAAATGAAIRAALARRGLVVAAAGIDAAGIDAAGIDAAGIDATPSRRIRLRPSHTAGAVVAGLVGAGLVGAGLVVAGVAGIRTHDRIPARTAMPAPVTSTVVEGRIAVAVPEGWAVERLTKGPGSRRVRVSSPADPDEALHITQSYVPETTLAEAGAVLGRAVAAQPPGVFVDFRSEDIVAGRPAITYREQRPGRVIVWAVLLDGSTRISIGCQRRVSPGDGIGAACEQAIRTARELVGTAARP